MRGHWEDIMSNASLFRRHDHVERAMLAAVMPRTPELDAEIPDDYAQMAERLVPALRVSLAEVAHVA